MEKFKVGDRVIKARPYSDKKYCSQGGSESSVPIGSMGAVSSISSTDKVGVEFDNGFYWLLDASELELSKGHKAKKEKAEDLVRYMVYGTGCDNKSEMYLSENEMSKEARTLARDSSWTGDIIGYKLTPLFKVEKKTILKKFKTAKKKAKK